MQGSASEDSVQAGEYSLEWKQARTAKIASFIVRKPKLSLFGCGGTILLMVIIAISLGALGFSDSGRHGTSVGLIPVSRHV
jgi:hypothetical protein